MIGTDRNRLFAPLWSPQADRGHPGGADSDRTDRKHQHHDSADDFIEKDASTGQGSRHSRQSRQDSDEIQGKDGAMNRAGDERGWNAKHQPRDNHGRFKTAQEKNAEQSGFNGGESDRGRMNESSSPAA